jgi:hypothetical protein
MTWQETPSIACPNGWKQLITYSQLVKASMARDSTSIDGSGTVSGVAETIRFDHVGAATGGGPARPSIVSLAIDYTA